MQSKALGASDTVEQRVFRRLLTRTILLPLILVSLLTGIFIFEVFYLTRINREITAADRAIAESSELLKLYVDCETGVRGYLITGQRDFLEPYVVARPQIGPQLEKLLSRFPPESPARTEALTLGTRFQSWTDFAEHVLALKDQHKNYQTYVISEVGKTIMDGLRHQLSTLVATEEKSRDQANARVTTLVYRLLGLTLLLSIGAGTYLAFFGRDQLYTLSRSYADTLNALQDAKGELEGHVQQRTRDLTAMNQELEAFSYSVSHDLRAPLRGIDGFSQALLEDYAQVLDARGMGYLRFVREGVQKMGRLIDDMLTLSRLSRAELSAASLDLAPLARQIIQGLQAAEPARRVQVEIPETIPAFGDAVLLEAMVENLVSNAWKFTSKVAEARIEVGASAAGGVLTVYVRDNGAGFDMAYANKLYGAFQRLHSPSEFKGTGVGLATVRRIVFRHGGKVWAEGQVGQGATFYFTLPIPV